MQINNKTTDTFLICHLFTVHNVHNVVNISEKNISTFMFYTASSFDEMSLFS